MDTFIYIFLAIVVSYAAGVITELVMAKIQGPGMVWRIMVPRFKVPVCSECKHCYDKGGVKYCDLVSYEKDRSYETCFEARKCHGCKFEQK